ncbi:MAG: hypothetical protein ACTSXD_07080 [Candidatus Heimdallarchaeaceae archaeon]
MKWSWIIGIIIVLIFIWIIKRKMFPKEDYDIIEQGKERGGLIGWCCSKFRGKYA